MLRTLIVDDNASFRQSFRDHLYQQFPEMIIEEAASAEEAIENIGSSAPHLVFVDIQLPGENGLELTRKIRAGHVRVTIAILTAYDLPEYRDAANECGANFFLSKGAYSMEEIISVVDTVLFERQRQGESEIP